ncbi:hypothetical protein RFI_32060 [Reticulomyxa filosa]|uniref:Uncharacterized protein n=1 Tax=Reticulomyxa filosa TaxID=46433 RepID=X6LW20_RETFI|nr:hypothetical protein RFI_32060 [Reticulomyxa filosa]|eukprot:ETO05337.1 hypothetical protein RFI_32060 [Reticulomyxa filosa]
MEQVSSLSCTIKHPLILLTGAIKYEQQSYLKNAKQDLYLLETLFQNKFGYQIFNTYDLQNPVTESLTFNGLNEFILKHCLNKGNYISYDGLIFVCQDRDIFNISVVFDDAESINENPFEIFYQVIENNIDKNLDLIIKQVIKNACDPIHITHFTNIYPY